MGLDAVACQRAFELFDALVGNVFERNVLDTVQVDLLLAVELFAQVLADQLVMILADPILVRDRGRIAETLIEQRLFVDLIRPLADSVPVVKDFS